jgi:GDP-4-dehydro-6-deoxy-D-mannose reductase
VLRVIVTGVRGFLGSYIADALSRRVGIKLVRFVRARGAPIDSAHERGVDLTDEREAEAALNAVKPDAVIHAAGRVHGTPLQLFRDNTVTTIVVANAILRACPSAVLSVLGSAAEYGRSAGGKPLFEGDPCRPITPYGHAKLAAANYLITAAEHGLRYNLVRVFNPIGEINSRAQVLGAFIAKAVKLTNSPQPQTVTMGRLDAIRDFVAMQDLVSLIIRLLEGRISGELVNACSGEGHCIRDLIQFLITTSQREYEVIEQGEAPPPGHQDIVVGDPTRFLTLSGLAAPTPIDGTLTRAWLRAVADHDATQQGRRLSRTGP